MRSLPRVEAMLATRADALKTGELADERAHERFPQPTGRSPRDRVGDIPIAQAQAADNPCRMGSPSHPKGCCMGSAALLDGARCALLSARMASSVGHANLGITSIYLQGVESSEIIDSVQSRPAPVVPAMAGLGNVL
jgi:hypothetical protein